MRLTFLGTSAGMPTKERNVTALALAVDDSRHWYLVDCGEATQHQLLHCPYTLNNLQAIFITHVHGDHMYGLPGLLTSASMQGRTQPLHICAPEGVETFVRCALECSDVYDLPYELNFIRCDQADFAFADGNMAVTAHELSHRVPSFAYRFNEHTHSTRLDTDKLDHLGVPRGELWGQLQSGKPVYLEDGSEVLPEQVMLPPPPARTVIIAGDNNRPELLLDTLKGADLLVHEATMTQEVLDRVGPVWMHSSARMVAEVAQQSGIPNLILTHFSGRYRLSSEDKESCVEVLRAEAEQFFDGKVQLARDLGCWELSQEKVLKIIGQPI